MDLVHFFSQQLNLETQVKNWQAPERHLVTGLSGSGAAVYLAGMIDQLQAPLLLVADNNFHASQYVEDLSALLGSEHVAYFPVEEVIAAQGAISSPEFRRLRIDALSFLTRKTPGVLVTSVAGFRYRLPQSSVFEQAQLHIQQDGELDLATLPKRLITMGYQREKLVAKPGEFAIRGDIIDIYPLAADYPLRVELFGDEVDSLRSFDPATQRSVQTLTEVTVLPASEQLVSFEQRQAAAERLRKALQKQLKRLRAKKTKPEELTNLQDYFTQAIDALTQNTLPEQSGLFVDYFYTTKCSLTDYLAQNGVVVFDDYSRLMAKADQLDQEAIAWQLEQKKQQHHLPEQQYRFDFRKLTHQLKQRQLFFALFQKGLGQLRFAKIDQVRVQTVQQFFSQMPLIKTELDHWRKQKRTVVILIPEANRRKRLQQTFADFEVKVALNEADAIQPGLIQLVNGHLRHGFDVPAAQLVVLTDHELFNRVRKKAAPRRQTMPNAERLRSYNELKPGDYVVHVNHGIGRYEGMETLTVDGVHRDYLKISYRDQAQLFIPVDQLNLISKYVSSEGKVPHINRLGGSEWQKTKQRVAHKIEDIADDLIDLYAKRRTEVGHAFPKDDDLQRQFESEFSYAETPDQLRSTAEVKHDMERSQPMDRLLVGDVGFGKTEVALRAAFKAISDNKQVAFLVPTTVLAQQHYETMKERFADYPVKIAMMSRFQTTAENKKTICQLKKGQIDMVVGTHRVLSKDVQFADLGLLIVDEEQRFGVKHKERLKQLKNNVDVLTLTATPIPRTLHMSMLGVRDLSVIETPPTNRYPIQTYVMEQNAGVIREAIERELERHGQVFYLHNRVGDIEQTVSELQALVPDATIAYAHGQMTENQLEQVIFGFINGEYDVLVTTTIIESGVDMPNANTLIVENADRYGLSQLYQLRGRVGRSSRIAYAYFMYQPAKVLSEIGEKRLQAIKDFTELGSGFKIAMRDLSIRGAGNLLGKQQHGFINSVGFDLYTQMLNDAVKKRKQPQAQAKTDAELNLDVEAYLPSDYIEDGRQKIELYKRIRQIENQAQLEEIQSDLIDRFGDYPKPVANLLQVAQVKLYADRLLLKRIRRQGQKLQLDFTQAGTAKISGEGLFAALSVIKEHANVKLAADQSYQLQVTLPKPLPKTKVWLQGLIKLLQAIEKNRHSAKQS